MHKTVKDFVGAVHDDETDKLAQRALIVLGKCEGPRGLIANAHNRGDAEAWTAVSRAHYEASLAFVLIHQTKGYAFGDEVLAGIAVQSVDAEDPAAAAAYLVDIAEPAIEAYADRCTPVCTIAGISSVRMLRGQHAANALHGVVVANAA